MGSARRSFVRCLAPLLAVVACGVGLVSPPRAVAAVIYKANNDDALNLTTSWWTTDAGTTNPASIGSTDTLWFGNGMGATRTLALGGDLATGALRLDNVSGSPNYSVTISPGNTLTLNANNDYGPGTPQGIVLNSGTGGSLTLSADVTLGNSQIWVTSRALNVGGGVALGGNTLSFNTAGSSVQTLSGVISGAGSLNKSAGPGTLALTNAANTFTGTVTLVGGNTTITSLADGGTNSSLGAGTSAIVMNGSNLTYVGTGSGSTNRAIDMRAAAIVNNNSASGAIEFTAASVLQGGAASPRTLTLGGSNAGDNTFGSVLGDSGTGPNISRLQKSNAGTWIVTGVHTYTGATVINQGTLRVSGSGVLGGAAGLTTDEGNIWFTSGNANAALEFETVANLGPASQIRFRNTTGPAAGQGGALVYIGTTNQTLGKTFQCDSSVGIRLESNSVGGSLTFNGAFSQSNRPLYLGGTGTGNNTLATAFTGTGGLTKRDAGTWVLSAANGHSGVTAVLGGTLRATNAGALGTTAGGTTIASGAALELAGGISIGAEPLSVAGTGVSGGGAIRSLSGNNAYGGAITATAAASIMADAGTLTLGGEVSSIFDTTFGGAGDIVAAGGLSAAGNVIKTGAGALTLSVGNSQANTTVSAGQLNVNHLAALGTSAGTLTMAAATTLDNTSGAAVTITNPKSIALGSSLTFVGSNSLDLGTGTVTLSGNTAIDVAASVLTFSGDVVGTGFGITKNGAGTLRLDGLTGSGSFTGNSFVNAGTLLIEGTAVLGGGASTVVTVEDNAFLQIGASAGLGDVTVVSRPGGVITASVVNANQTFDQSGTLTASNANFNGIQTIESGVTISSSANYLGTIPGTATPGRIVFQDTARLRATDDFTIGATQGISLQAGTATLETDAGKALLIPAIVAGSGGLRKVGPGNVRLTANNTYTGGTVVEAGLLGISYGDSLGDVSGRLKLDGGTIVGAQTLSAPFISSVTIDPARPLVLANGKTSGIDAQTGLSLRYDGVIAEETLGGVAANLRVGSSTAREGTVILGGANTYTGTTAVDHGKLFVNGSIAASSLTTVAGGATLGGSGTVGATRIQGGAFHAPGTSPGIQTITSGLEYQSAATLTWELFANTTAGRGTSYDGVDLAGGALVVDPGAILALDFGTSAGGSTVDWSNPFWGSDQSWTIIAVGGSASWDGSVFGLLSVGSDALGQSLASVRPDASFSVANVGGDLTLHYVAVPEPGALAVAAAAGLGLAGLAGFGRRRRRPPVG